MIAHIAGAILGISLGCLLLLSVYGGFKIFENYTVTKKEPKGKNLVVLSEREVLEVENFIRWRNLERDMIASMQEGIAARESDLVRNILEGRGLKPTLSFSTSPEELPLATIG